MADESSEGRRYSYKPKKKLDEESEGRRYSYKTKKKVQSNRQPVAKAKEKAERPRRMNAQAQKKGEVRPKQKPSTWYGHEENIGFAKETPRERAINQDRRRWFDQADRERNRDRIYADIPHEPVRRLRPEGGPVPMIEPGVGPVHQLREQAAHSYGFTPEAYRALRQVPISMAPATNDLERSVYGAYMDDPPGIYIRSGDEGVPQASPGTLAHEQAHAWWWNKHFNDPQNGTPYTDSLDRWTSQKFGPEGRPYDEGFFSVGDLAKYDWQQGRQWYDEHGQQGEYQAATPTEEYARTVEFSPLADDDRSNWPSYMRPWYKGLLQGMDTLPNGEIAPDVNRYPERDASTTWTQEPGEYGISNPRPWDKRGW